MKESKSVPMISVPPKPDQQEWTNRSDSEAKTIRISGAADAESPTVLSPTPLASLYSIVEKIGDGGMGLVFLAQDRRLGRYVAIKRLNRASLANPKLKERFLREAKAIASLNHIHIVHIYALGEDENGPYIVMEYVPGPLESTVADTPPPPFSLADWIGKHGPFSSGEAVDFILKISRAIEYAHSCSVIHRDLKPSNILIDTSWEPKIVDFGLARMFGDNESQITVPGDKMLSLGYGAPEQEVDAALTDERADIYGLGALLSFALTGKNPRYFRENDIPEALRMIVVKALATDRTKRWQSAREFTNAILSVRTPTQTEIPTAKTTWRCKWCDTINPITLKYCGNCGWDGTEYCPECAAEMRIGIQFCGNCGVDAREYDAASRLRDLLRRQKKEKNYEKVIQNSDKIVSFKPAGFNGKQIIDEIAQLRNECEDFIRRGKHLIDMIKLRMNERNYEEARDLIQEYHDLTGKHDFDRELDNTAGLIRSRDIEMAQNAAARKDWQTAVVFYERLLKHASADNQIVQMAQKARQNALAAKVRRVTLNCFILFLFYILSFGPVEKVFGKAGAVRSAFYRPIVALHDYTILEKPLDWFASLWNAEAMFRGATVPAVAHRRPHPQATVKLQQLSQFRQQYEQSLKKVDTDADAENLKNIERYGVELKDLLKKMQEAGDYEGWVAVKSTVQKFETDSSIPEEIDESLPRDLVTLQKKYQKAKESGRYGRNKNVLSTTENYVKQLSDLQRSLTQSGKTDDAATVNMEIKRVRASPEVTSAAREIAVYDMDQKSGNRK